MSTAGELVRTATTLAATLQEAIADDAALSGSEVAAAVAEAREAIQDAIDAALVEWGLDAAPLVTALRVLAAALLDGQRLAAAEEATELRVWPAEQSLLAAALELYGDDNDVITRAGQLLRLNPGVANPARVRAGREVVVHVS